MIGAMSVHVRPATTADASRLSTLAATTFRETFEPDNTPDDMARYLAESFTPERQMQEIASDIILLAEHVDPSGDAEMVGYAHLVASPTPPAVRAVNSIELKRLYVARAWHGKRVAQALMDRALDAARARGAQMVWLGVWERNPRAVAFYVKYGFRRVGEHVFTLGDDPQTDWIFERAL